MIDFTAKIAAALAVTAGLATPVLAAPVAELSVEQTVATEQVELAYFCEYVIVFDVWGNAYYQYLCY